MNSITKRICTIYKDGNYIFYRKAQFECLLTAMLILFSNILSLINLTLNKDIYSYLNIHIYNLGYFSILYFIIKGKLRIANVIFILMGFVRIIVLYSKQDFFQLIPMLFLATLIISIVYISKREYIYSMIFCNFIYLLVFINSYIYYLDDVISFKNFISLFSSYMLFFLYNIVIYNLSNLIKNELIKTERLSSLAYTDHLTGLYNRSKFNDFSKSVIESDNFFSVMILDIDYFKNINDKFGHKKGDYVLIEFATIVEDFLDADHHLFRWGGEEFVIIFENYTKTKAHNIGQKLLKKIKKHDFGINTPLSFSGGVTDYNRIDDLAVTLEKADQALYRAKNEGRGKIIIS